MNKKNFLYFLMLSYVFIATSALALKGGGIKEVLVLAKTNRPKVAGVSIENYAPVPVIKNSNTFPIVSAQSVYAVDLDSHTSLFEKNSDKTLLPASTTKIMTALVALDTYSLDAKITVPDFNVVGQKMGLRKGEVISVKDLMYGLLVYSANDAAEVFAISDPGGRGAFIQKMNIKAKELNLNNTRFDNPVGLDSENNFSTAKDLVRLTEIALNNSLFSTIVGTKTKIIYNEQGKAVYRLENTNKLLGSVEGVMGVKTGWTENARENLVTYIKRDNKRILIALLGSQDRFGETREIIKWIFDNYTWEKLPPDTTPTDYYSL